MQFRRYPSIVCSLAIFDVKWPSLDAEHLLVTAQEMADIEGALIRNGMPVASLMEKVGQMMFSWLQAQEGLLEKGVVVLVGPGHNGGDGLVVARELHLSGVDVQIWCPFPIKKSLTAEHLAHCEWLGIENIESSPEMNSPALWIDAIFGLGQSRKLPKFISDLFISRQLEQPYRLISIDVPTGICSDSGNLFSNGAAVASVTLTVGLIKQGLYQDAALNNVGRVERLDLGIPFELLSKLHSTNKRLIFPADIDTAPWPSPSIGSMKYERGRVLVVAGSNKFPGAASLSLQGALASGAGNVKAIVPDCVGTKLWQQFPEIVLEDSFNGEDDVVEKIGNSLSEINLDRFDSILIGPGIGSSDSHFNCWSDSLSSFKGLLVLDADALNNLASFAGGVEWLIARDSPVWITPHRGEFSRIFPELKKPKALECSY